MSNIMSNRKADLARRAFLRNSAGAGIALSLQRTAAASTKASSAASAQQTLGANDRVRLGAIGTGGRTLSLLDALKKLPGNTHVAVCDVYEPRLLQAAEVAGPGVKQFKDYRQLLDSKEIDAVVIGSPDHWHKQMTLDAIDAGKDVYIEKPISHSIEEGAQMVKAVESSKRVVQTGTQQRSWKHYIAGKQLVDAGKLGQITLVRAYWYQNYTGKQAPSDFAANKLDVRAWLGPAREQVVTPEKYRRWRWYWDFGGGALTDLMTHWIDVIQWYMETPAPKTVSAHGNLYAMVAWECPDTITCVLDYPKNYSVVYDGTMTSKIDDGGIEFRGTLGTLKINRERLAFYSEDSKNPAEPETLIRSEENGTLTHVRNFLDCVRSRQTPTANIRVAHEAARASHLGNISLRQQRPVKWNAAAERVES